MISFFRGALRSPLVLGLFGLILVAFVITGVNSPSDLGALATGDHVATIGNQTVTVADAEQRVKNSLDAARQEQPGLDMTAFAAGGGIEGTIDGLIDRIALEEFGLRHGMTVGKRQIDGQIASIQAFNGPTGKFDPNIFRQVLSQRRLLEKDVRQDFSRQIISAGLTAPATIGARGSANLVTPYAALVLEERSGQVAFLDNRRITIGAAPTPAELNTFYTRNAVRYTVPETRSVRYAVFDRDRFKSSVLPTEAEIAAAYKKNSAAYAATETRGFEQVIVQSEAVAKTIAAKASAGTALGVAAKASGFEATRLDPQDKEAFTGLTSGAIATAGFTAKSGAILVPMKSALGWHVVKVSSINITPVKQLSAVRGDILAVLSKGKLDGVIADFVSKIEDAIADGSTFDDVVKAEKLAIVSTPAVTAAGIAPDTPAYKAPPEIPGILRDAFQDEADADPAVVTLSPGAVYALYDLDRINAAAPRPLAAIKGAVTGDFLVERVARASRKIADGIAAKVTKGMSLSAAVAEAGARIDTPISLSGKRRDLAKDKDGNVPAPLALMFSIAPKRAKTVEAPGKQGWYIVYLNEIKVGDPKSDPTLIPQMAAEFSQLLSAEYAKQLTTAIRADLKVSKNDAAIKALRKGLTGGQ